MSITASKIIGCWILEHEVYVDSRGSFQEWFKSQELENVLGREFSVKQANQSVSSKGVLRGIHYSLAKSGQAKWITCMSGQILDFVIDIRPESSTFKKYELFELNAGDGRAVFIGAGLGHAFLSLEDNSIVSYLLDSPYSPSEEFEINPMDPELGIDWQFRLEGGKGLILSPKDAQAPTLAERLAQGKLPMFK